MNSGFLRLREIQQEKVHFNTQISHKFVGYNNSTDHGKAVFKNNKENGSHLLAQPDRTNVQTTNLSDPQYILYIFHIHNPPNMVAVTI